MPTYAYQCSDCGKEHEEIQKITDQPLKICPFCKKETLKRGPGGGIGLSFKGTGFYITDYARQSSPEKKSEPIKQET